MRNYIRNFMEDLSEAAIDKKSLFKNPERVDAMVQMLTAGEAFEMVDGRLVVINPKDAAALLRSLSSRNYPAYLKTLEAGITAREVDEDGKIIKKAAPVAIDSLNQFLKTKKLGSTKQSERERAAAIARGEKVKTTGESNESGFVSAINGLVKKSPTKTINIDLGGTSFIGVSGAKQTGSSRGADGLTSKADVVLSTFDGPIGLSLKLDSAEYYLSGDYLLGDIAIPILDMIMGNKAEGLSMKKEKQEDETGKKTVMNKIVNAEGKPVNITFPISASVARKAAFGLSPDNKIDYIVKGDLNAKPVEEKSRGETTYAWPSVNCIVPDLKNLKDDLQPVGLIRHASDRGVGNYRGLRVAIVNKSRAKNAIDISELVDYSTKGQKLRTPKQKAG